MIIAAVALATFWAWQFIFAYVPWLPDYVAHFLVPLMAFGFFFLPQIFLLPLAVAAIVGLLHRLANSMLRTNTQVTLPKRRSNIPPPPR
jgi:hypothetical protein